MTAFDKDISLSRVTALLLASRAVRYVLLLCNSVIVARALGVERLGQYAYAMGIAALFGLVPNWGISTIVTRSIARDPTRSAGVVGASLKAQALLAIGVLIVIPAFSSVLPEQPIPLSYVGLAAAQLALGTMSWPYLAVVSGRARYDLVAKSELITGLVATTLILGSALLQGTIVAILLAQTLAAGFAVFVAKKIAAPYIPTEGREQLGLYELFKQGAPFGATAAVQSLYTRLDVLLLGQMAPIKALGLYNVAYKPTTMAVYFGSTVAGTLFPILARTAQQDLPPSFHRALRGLWALAPAMALALGGLAEPLLHVLYGAAYIAAAPILILLACSAAMNWCYAPLGVALQARGRERVWLVSLMVGLLLNAIGNLVAIPIWGARGAAGATVASEFAILGLAVFLTSRELAFLPPYRLMWGSLGAAIIGVTVLLSLQVAGPFFATLAALCAYAGILFALRIFTSEDVAGLLQSFRQSSAAWNRT